jgi:hypothetical protein
MLTTLVGSRMFVGHWSPSVLHLVVEWEPDLRRHLPSVGRASFL